MPAGALRLLLFTCAALSATSARCFAGPMEIPTNARLLITGTNQANVMWEDNSTGETGYEVQRRTGDTGTWSLVQSPAANATSWTDAAVPANNHVYYRIRTKNGTSGSAWSNVACLTNPGDSDADGIPDTAETAAGLDPSDWKDATADLDGDGVPNLWEHALSTDMTNDASKPAPTMTVDPNVAETATVKRTINNAINWLPASPVYAVIVVKPGVYEENINLGTTRKIALVSDGSGTPPEIRGFSGFQNGAQVVHIQNDAVVDGFRITRRLGDKGSGMLVLPNNGPRLMARVVNCSITGQQQPTGVGTAVGIEHRYGRLVIAHSTIYGNTRNGGMGASLYSSTSFDTPTFSVNSVFWNAPSGVVSEIHHVGTPTFVNCIIRNGSTWGGITSDPSLNPLGYLTAGSPAIDAGAPGHGAPWDINVEARDANPDIGIDELIDADSDGIPDRYETGGNLLPGNDDDGDGLNNLDEHATHGTDPIDADSDGDGLDDGDEVAAGTNAHISDTDDDGLPDGYEVLHGLDPLSIWDRLGDADGDRIPNFWEYKRGTSASNAGSKPATDWIVSPSQAGTGIYKATIQQAINAAAAAGGHAVIEVRPGIYNENIAAASGILLLADQQTPPVTILGLDTSYAVKFVGEAVIDGFRITRLPDAAVPNYPGVFVDVDVKTNAALDRAQNKVVNCLIHGHNGFEGAGAQLVHGRLTVSHCTITGNSASSRGNGISVMGGSKLHLVNSIVWNPAGASSSQVYKTTADEVIVTNALIYGGEYGAMNTDPLLTYHGFLSQSSPAINAGASAYAASDYQGDLRGGSPDLGADEFADTDSDGLPDWVEALGAANPGDDSDSDGLTNLVEYTTYGTHAHLADTDGDGLNDGGEITAGTDPHDPDSDNDNMTDGFEVTYGFDPEDWHDAMEDEDGDRIPNVYEWAKATNPLSSSSFPAPDFIVEPATAMPTIYAAVNASGNWNYRIILVKPGTYNQMVDIFTGPMLLLGEQGTNAPVIELLSNSPCVKLQKRHCGLDGFVIRHAPQAGHHGVAFGLVGELYASSRVANCVITNNAGDYGAGILAGTGELIVDHCTIVNNRCSSYVNGSAGIEVTAAGRLRLRNSIVWNPTEVVGAKQVRETTVGTVSVSNSIILGAEHGASGANPMLGSGTALLTSSSPAIDGGAALTTSIVVKDIHGEIRDATPDIGADEYIDSDTDGLADIWEQEYYGGLTWSDDDDSDGDGLTNAYEVIMGFDPTVADTDGDGTQDWYQAIARAALVFNNSSDLADDDSDGLTNAQEMLVGSNPLVADTNGDGIRDGASWKLRFNPSSTDSDGDGVSNSTEISRGTSPILADTDRDGVADGADAFPLDPAASSLPPGSGDTTPPGIILTKPPGAVLIP